MSIESRSMTSVQKKEVYILGGRKLHFKITTMLAMFKITPKLYHHQSFVRFKSHCFTWRRKKGVLPKVADQGNCGSCWTYSVTGAIESLYNITTGKKIKLSNQELLDCAYNIHEEGGSLGVAYAYIFENGISLESEYPYEAKHYRPNRRHQAKKRFYIDGFARCEVNEEGLMRLVEKQPVSVSICSGVEYASYVKGQIYDEVCTHYVKVREGCHRKVQVTLNHLNHMVLVTGYGESGGKYYFEVQNSWGGQFGDSGFFRVRRKSDKELGQCRILENVYIPIMSRGPRAEDYFKPGRCHRTMESVYLEPPTRSQQHPSGIMSLSLTLDALHVAVNEMRVESCLSRVEQTPLHSMLIALCPSLKALVGDKLVRLSHHDVKVALASYIKGVAYVAEDDALADAKSIKKKEDTKFSDHSKGIHISGHEELNDLFDGKADKNEPKLATKKSRRKSNCSIKSANPSECQACNDDSEVVASAPNVEVAEASSKKVSEGASISEAKVVKRSVRKVLGRSFGVKNTVEIDSSKNQSGADSCADAKKHSAKKLDDNEGGGTSSRQLVVKEMVSSPTSGTKSSKNEKLEETTKRSAKRKHTSGSKKKHKEDRDHASLATSTEMSPKKKDKTSAGEKPKEGKLGRFYSGEAGSSKSKGVHEACDQQSKENSKTFVRW